MTKRLLSLLGIMALLTWLSYFPHEGAHMLVAKSLGIEGTVHFWWEGKGFFAYAQGQTILPWQDAAIGLAGGLIAGVVFLLVWLLTGHLDIKQAPSEVNNSFPFLFIAIFQLVYAPFDAGARYLTQYGSALGILLGVAIPVLIYHKPLWKWLEGST